MTNDQLQVPQPKALNPYASAGLDLGGDLIGSVVNNIWAERHARKAYERQVQFWNMQNEYNHPKAVMERLKNSGINPHAFYQKGTYQAQSQSAPTIAKAQTFGINPRLVASLEAVARINNINEDTKQKEVRTEGFAQDNVAKMRENFIENMLAYTSDDKVLSWKDGTAMSATKAFAQYVKGELNKPLSPRVKMEFDKIINQSARNEGISIDNEIKNVRKQLVRVGVDFKDEMAVKAGVLMAKSQGIDVNTIRGAIITADLIRGILGMIPRVGSMQRGRTGTQYVEQRDVYSREGQYMGGTRTQRNYKN